MAVMARESWTDERLDDLNAKVDIGFAEMRSEFRGLRAELKEMRGDFQQESRELRTEFKAEMREMRSEFQEDMRELRTGTGETQRLILRSAAALWSTSMIGFLGVIATVATKL